VDRELTGKVALVTGASRGIGAATAIALANHGVKRLLLHYNSYKPGIESLLNAVRGLGVQADAIQADLGADAGIWAVLQAMRAAGAAIDILINNAGFW
jgi:3-oxoacyl-[acyl-carrier protein] reductase